MIAATAIVSDLLAAVVLVTALAGRRIHLPLALLRVPDWRGY